MHFVLFINYDEAKTTYDKIKIQRNNDEFTAVYSSANTTMKTTVDLRTEKDLLEYVEDMMDLMYNDRDKDSPVAIDVIIPGLPITCLRTTEFSNKELLLRVVRNYVRRI